MLKYLVILLDKACPSFCHYSIPEVESELISIDNLKKAVKFGMMENLNIQIVMPRVALPVEYQEYLFDVSASKIVEYTDGLDADVYIVDNVYKLPKNPKPDVPYVVLVNRESFKDNIESIVNFANIVQKVNVVFTDVDSFDSNTFIQYSSLMDSMVGWVKAKYVFGHAPQINILTDRMQLEEMNNCNAGWESITVAPDGKFYVCPAFYYDEDGYNVGDLDSGLKILNPQLYRLDHAPLCRECDAFQCKRCVWLNKKLTKEVGIPSRQQCVMSHIERNASRKLLYGIREHGEFLSEKEINEIDYLDPFDNKIKK